MNSEPTDPHDGVAIVGPEVAEAPRVLAPEALAFAGLLEREFGARRRELLARRQEVQTAIDSGILPGFLEETAGIRAADWKISPIPDDLQDRRVEITGPVDRKMVINALNSGANVYMADFEDSHCPTWPGTIQGQANLQDAVNRTITYDFGGKHYRLNDRCAVLVVRPRGWHLVEKHVQVDGLPISAGIFDFAMFMYHNAQRLIDGGSGPYFYLPKMESHLEARLWNDIFVCAQQLMNIPIGTIKATVLIETLPAAFEMDEILYELREHMAGLNCGRWDYIFSTIKRLKNTPGFIMPDRSSVSMTSHCMHSYSLLAIKTCHRRGAHAIGGMAAQIPIKEDSQANAAALQKVREDKIREAGDGHDGTWVAHPGLVALARKEFDRLMPTPNQIHRLREDVTISADDLLKVPDGSITETGLRTNVSVGIQYMAAWLSGNGCVPLYHLMEDVATAEISRTQLWQWVHHPKGVLNDGRRVTLDLFREVMAEEMAGIRAAVGDDAFATGNYRLAARLFDEIVSADILEEFLTLRAYAFIE